MAEADVGPALPPADAGADDGEGQRRKKRKVLPFENLFLDQIPNTEIYERSFMHRDTVSHILITKTDFIITASIDGHVKFWKKTADGIEFVKHFKAHLGPLTGLSVCSEGFLLASASTDKTIKIFDVINFDMINMLKLDIVPQQVTWIHKKGQAQPLIAVGCEESGAIRIYDAKNTLAEPVTTLNIHSQPVIQMKYNEKFHSVISVDNKGIIEYWSADEPYSLPSHVSFEFKSDTDLYEYAKTKSLPTSLAVSADGNLFVSMCSDRQIRIFRYLTGRLHRKYDESLQLYSEMQQAGTLMVKLDDMEFGRRSAVEREIEKVHMNRWNVIFDESSNFIIYATMIGIKVVNIFSNKVARLVGTSEGAQRFLYVQLYQGAPRKKTMLTLAAAASDNPTLQAQEETDPTLLCTAMKRNRFYLFTKRLPDENDGATRDIFNEKPTREEQTVATEATKGMLASTAVIHTTLGDIHLKLFPKQAPKTVENFATHAKDGYFNNVIFHRVIKNFMIQTGDPLGDGTGGESIWGGEFNDEFSRELRHDRAYTLSMANAGPNTNGSQFFITTVPTPWLDNKHTVFGRCTAGMDVVHAIENVKVDKNEKPFDDVKIINIDIIH